jgi:hypothetical protein
LNYFRFIEKEHPGIIEKIEQYQKERPLSDPNSITIFTSLEKDDTLKLSGALSNLYPFLSADSYKNKPSKIKTGIVF